jgi:hypothetical protein
MRGKSTTSAIFWKEVHAAVTHLAADARLNKLPTRIPIRENARACRELWERGWVIVTGVGRGREASEKLPTIFFQGSGISLLTENELSLITEFEGGWKLHHKFIDWVRDGWLHLRKVIQDQQAASDASSLTVDDQKTASDLKWQQPLLLHTDAMYFGHQLPDIVMVSCDQPCKWGGGSLYGIDGYALLECMKEDPVLATWQSLLTHTPIDLTIRKTSPRQGPDGCSTIGYADGDEAEGPFVLTLPNQRRCLRRYPRNHEKSADFEGSYESLFTVLPQSLHPDRDADMLLVLDLAIQICGASAPRFMLKEGEALVFDNLRMLHGRDRFADATRTMWRCPFNPIVRRVVFIVFVFVVFVVFVFVVFIFAFVFVWVCPSHFFKGNGVGRVKDQQRSVCHPHLANMAAQSASRNLHRKMKRFRAKDKLGTVEVLSVIYSCLIFHKRNLVF